MMQLTPNKNLRSAMLVATFGALCVGATETPRQLPKEGTILFLGDSITWQNLYVAYVEAILSRREETRRLRVINSGVRGDMATDTRRRIERDVVPHDPTVVVVMLGINDGGLGGINGRLIDAYERNIGRLVKVLREKTDARILLLTSTCVDPTDKAKRTYNKMLSKMAQRLLSLGRRERLETIDIYGPFCRALRQARSQSSPVNLMADALHPGPAGHLIIANAILERLLPDQKPTPPFESSVPGSICTGKPYLLPIEHDHQNVWFPPDARAGLAWEEMHRRFNSRKLKLQGPTCTVNLSVEGESIGNFKPDELAAGIDLNLIDNTPWVREAKRLFQFAQSRWQWSYGLWDPRALGAKRALRDVGASAEQDDAASSAKARDELKRLSEMLERSRPQQTRSYELRIERAR